jgi:hypothetical protein
MEAVNINFLVVGLMISCSGTLKEEEEQTETSQILVFWHIREDQYERPGYSRFNKIKTFSKALVKNFPI